MGNVNSVKPQDFPGLREDNPWSKQLNAGEEPAKLPLPRPPNTPKAEIFNSDLFQAIDHHAKKKIAIKTLNTTYEEVSFQITKTCRSDLERARAIFTWLTTIDPSATVKNARGLIKEGSPIGYLQRIAKRTGNKAFMYSYLCIATGIPCVLIAGINKSSAYKIGSTIAQEELAAQWNAVLIDEEWRLVDTFWGSTSTAGNSNSDWLLLDDKDNKDNNTVIDMEAKEELSVNEFFFLTDPKMLISTHFPNDVQWQMLDSPIDITLFEKQAYLRDRFFDMDAQIIDQSLPYCITEADGEIDIVFGIPAVNAQYLQFRYLIYQERGQPSPDDYRLERYVLYQKKTETVNFNIQFPVDGRFKVDIFGKHKIHDETFELVASYIANAKGKEDAQPLPDEPEIGWGAGTEMEEKGLEATTNDAIIETQDGCVELRFHKSTPLSVLQALRHNNIDDWLLQRVSVIWEDDSSGENDVVVSIRLPEPGQYAFKLYADDPENEGELENICNYLLKSVNPRATPNLYPKLYHWVLGKGHYADELDVKADSNPESHLKTDDGKLRLVFTNPPEQELLLQLTCNTFDNELLAKCIKRTEEDGQTIFEINLPDATEYGINVYSAEKEGKSATLHHVHSCLVDSQQDFKRVTSAEIIEAKKEDVKTEIETFRKLEKVPLPPGPFENTLVGSLQRQQAQDPIDQFAVMKVEDGENDVFKVNLPELGKYDLDIFEKKGNGALLSTASVIITRRPARDGEIEVEEIEQKQAPVAIDIEDDAQKEIERNYGTELKELRLAVKVLDDEAIEQALAVIHAKGDIPELLQEEVTNAQDLMKEYRKHRDALKSSMDKGNINQLDKAIKALENANPKVQKKLDAELKHAKAQLERLRRIEKFRHAVLKLKKTTIAEIRAYSTPPKAVHDVMGATFIILGEKEKTAMDWTEVRALIGKTGKTNLLRRIQLYDVNMMTEETLSACKGLMKGLDMNIIRDVSVGAAAFFVWVDGMMETAEENFADF